MEDDYWRFVVEVVDTACERWQEADRGIWEIRGEPQHFVHSKVMCWQAVDRGVALAEAYRRTERLEHWRRTAAEIRASVEGQGIDPDRGCFVQAYGSRALDSALLLIPGTGFVRPDDQVMVRTVDALRQGLEEDGLLLRYRTEHTDDGLGTDREGMFLACTFWLAECLAGQGRTAEAQAVFDRVRATANDLGLFAEEFDPERGETLGNFPQGLSHLSHIAAAAALQAELAAGSQVGTGR
jgi:GH15 family glucan-1,4-alpha-glucosidase